MIFGGIQAVTGRGLAGLSVATAAAAGFDVLIAILSPLLSIGLIYEEWAAFVEASSQIPGASGGMIGGLVGAAFGSLLYVGLAGFWFWAFRKVAAVRAEQPGL